MTNNDIIERGVKYIKNFGFYNVTKENILTDDVYSFHFKRFLALTKGESFDNDKTIDKIIELIDLKAQKK